MSTLLPRQLYLDRLLSYRGKPLVKIITGMRRTGKSSLLELLYERLKENTAEKHIIKLNFESLQFATIKNHLDLYEYVKARISKTDQTFLLFDEIQNVESWEKAITSFQVDFKVDIYLTGSNAYVLSSDLATRLAGRYVRIPVYPLSFGEFLDFNLRSREQSLEDNFVFYLKYGGLPVISGLDEGTGQITAYLADICNTVIMKDVMQRHEITDASLLENILMFVAQNIGNQLSPNKISDYLTSNGRATKNETVDNYLRMLENAFIIRRVPRYDLKGKALLKTLGKYYLADTGLRGALIGDRDIDRGSVLENVVYLELLRRGYQVMVGKTGEREVDFVASKFDKKKYFQVTRYLNEQTSQREFEALRGIDDNYEKIIISTDKYANVPLDGIEQANVIDWLLSP